MDNKASITKKGSAAAALIAAGIGSLFMGILTTGAELNGPLHDLLDLYAPSGPLSGKTTFTILIWLLSWWFLNNRWGNEDYDLDKAYKTFLVLLILGILLTFPPIFTLFA